MWYMNTGSCSGAPRDVPRDVCCDVQVSGRVPGSPDRVWSVLADVRSWPAWLPTVTSVHSLEPATPDGVGAAYDVGQPRLGTARWVITDWRPGAGFTWVTRRPGVVTTGTHEVRATSDRQGEPSVEVELGIGWQGPLAWVARLGYRRLTERYIARELAALADVMTTAGASRPSE
jgi:hypothetical protein